jgi:hypothetical protein
MQSLPEWAQTAVNDHRLTADAVRLVLYVGMRGPGEHEIPSDDLKGIMRCRSEKPVRSARDCAERAGYLTWRQGGRDTPNRYALVSLWGHLSRNEPEDRCAAGDTKKDRCAPEDTKEKDRCAQETTYRRTTPPPASTPPTPTGEPEAALVTSLDETRLGKYLGPHTPALARMAVSAAHGGTWQAAILGKWGPDGTQLHEWKTVPKDERAAVLAAAIHDYASEGKAFKARYFDGFVRNAIDGYLNPKQPKKGGNNEKAQRTGGGPSANAATGTDGKPGGRRGGFVYG